MAQHPTDQLQYVSAAFTHPSDIVNPHHDGVAAGLVRPWLGDGQQVVRLARVWSTDGDVADWFVRLKRGDWLHAGRALGCTLGDRDGGQSRGEAGRAHEVLELSER